MQQGWCASRKRFANVRRHGGLDRRQGRTASAFLRKKAPFLEVPQFQSSMQEAQHEATRMVNQPPAHAWPAQLPATVPPDADADLLDLWLFMLSDSIAAVIIIIW